ncbi:hypothetical protein [Adlercreutzia shanghongiae]|uniref:Uncharacterized protein n=1 Tax=Adlercreutzia shanghongiae TaxID=3111773 RepID=A0ABU6IWV1_9ACTN|nr:hypothetical protein [Adlercreutzia sp. R22]MEC4294155.1 hypothetical protein [Adlercreutzia sp. R22]
MGLDPKSDPNARIVVKPLPSQLKKQQEERRASKPANDPFIRAENEDDDGYDPYSDRPAEREPLFSEDPWN